MLQVRRPDAQLILSLMYDKSLGAVRSPKEAARLYRLATDQGHVYAQCRFGFMYEKGGASPVPNRG